MHKILFMQIPYSLFFSEAVRKAAFPYTGNIVKRSMRPSLFAKVSVIKFSLGDKQETICWPNLCDLKAR